MKNFETTIVADSVNPDGQRITSFLLTYPRFIHSELLTHRSFSRNAASSRAIPIEKMIEQVQTNPAMPIRWGKNGKGMQDHGEFTGKEAEVCQYMWQEASKVAVHQARILNAASLHKGLVNRVLEPFVWMTTLVTATEWQNFFALRVHKDAQPEFQHLAHLMLQAYVKNQPAKLEWGDWHIPFSDRMPNDLSLKDRLKVAVARAARTSYLTMDGQIDVEKDIALHDRLAESGHMSPFEHVAKAKLHENSSNFYGWNQYRHSHFWDCENRTIDFAEHLAQYEQEIGYTAAA